MRDHREQGKGRPQPSLELGSDGDCRVEQGAEQSRASGGVELLPEHSVGRDPADARHGVHPLLAGIPLSGWLGQPQPLPCRLVLQVVGPHGFRILPSGLLLSGGFIGAFHVHGGELLPGEFREHEPVPGRLLLSDGSGQAAVPRRVELPAGLGAGQPVLFRELLSGNVGEREPLPAGLLLPEHNAAACLQGGLLLPGRDHGVGRLPRRPLLPSRLCAAVGLCGGFLLPPEVECAAELPGGVVVQQGPDRNPDDVPGGQLLPGWVGAPCEVLRGGVLSSGGFGAGDVS